MSLVKKWTRFRQLAWSERLLLLEAAFLFPVIGLGLRSAGFNRLYGWMGRGAVPRAAFLEGQDDLGAARTMATLVEAASRVLPYRPKCLQRSLVLWWCLRRHGLGAELRIGVRRPPAGEEPAPLEAHAWIELEGSVLNDQPSVRTRFQAFDHAILPAGVRVE